MCEDFIPEEVVGPIILILSDLESLGCTMGQDLIIRQEDESDIDIWNMPWQHLKAAIISNLLGKEPKPQNQSHRQQQNPCR